MKTQNFSIWLQYIKYAIIQHLFENTNIINFDMVLENVLLSAP